MTHDLTFIHGSDVPRCTAVVDKRFIGYHTLQFVYEGEIELSYNSKHYVLAAPYVWPCNPGPHIYFTSTGASWYHFHIAVTGPLVDRWLEQKLWPDAPLPVQSPEMLYHDWQKLLGYSSGTVQAPWQHQRAVNTLEKILLDIVPENDVQQKPTWLAEAQELLERGLDQKSVAKKIGLAVSTFRRQFTDLCHVCPQDWLAQLRIDRARQLLTESPLTVSEIAFELDFYDPAHFSRYFKTRVGLSPMAYKESVRMMK
ncbi:MAG: helix-turn-helix transcriptional regulator [Planctomycetes bacterium]|nr:helix-turn-helix transcriptional regulator [Planctomycetota bacterium]